MPLAWDLARPPAAPTTSVLHLGVVLAPDPGAPVHARPNHDLRNLGHCLASLHPATASPSHEHPSSNHSTKDSTKVVPRPSIRPSLHYRFAPRRREASPSRRVLLHDAGNCTPGPRVPAILPHPVSVWSSCLSLGVHQRTLHGRKRRPHSEWARNPAGDRGLGLLRSAGPRTELGQP